MEITSDSESSSSHSAFAFFDPFFLYSLQVTEQDFHLLKKDQCLLVDFKSFPAKVIELLDLCNAQVRGTDAEQSPTAASQGVASPGKFFVGLKIQDIGAVMSIIEANQFKHLTHLSLSFRASDDTTMKKYLASRLKQSLTTSARLSQQLTETRTELVLLKDEHRDLGTKFSDLSTRSTQREEEMRFDFKKELETKLSNQKEESRKLLKQTEEALTQQKEDLSAKLTARVTELETRLDAISAEKGQLDKRTMVLESENQNLKNKLMVLTETEHMNNAELERLRDQNMQFSIELVELKTEDGKNAVLLHSLKEQMSDKHDNLAKTLQLLENSKQKESSNSGKLTLYKKNTLKLQKKLEISINEINKGNEVIEKLQGEIKAQRLKIKNKNMVIRQQEKYVEELKHAREKMERQHYTLETDLKTEKEAGKQLKDSLALKQDKLEECHQVLESNKNVINYLNKEINKQEFDYSLSLGHKDPPALKSESHFKSPLLQTNTGARELDSGLNKPYDYESRLNLRGLSSMKSATMNRSDRRNLLASDPERPGTVSKLNLHSKASKNVDTLGKDHSHPTVDLAQLGGFDQFNRMDGMERKFDELEFQKLDYEYNLNNLGMLPDPETFNVDFDEAEIAANVSNVGR